MQNLNDNKSTIPKYLEELVKPTLMSTAKLISAWDVLSCETQIMILSDYISKHPLKLKSSICFVASKSINKYIKYLAETKGFGNDSESNYLILESSSILSASIEYKKLGSGIKDLLVPSVFFNKSQFERIAIICQFYIDISSISLIIKYFYENKSSVGCSNENDLVEILEEYFHSENFLVNYVLESKFDSRDIWNSFQLDDIWRVIKYCNDDVGKVIIGHVSKAIGNRFVDSDELFDGVSESLIQFALSKKENEFPHSRYNILHNNKYSIETRKVAVKYGTIYTGINSWLIEIIGKNREDIVEMIALMSFSTGTAPTALCVIHDWFDVFIDSNNSDNKFESEQFVQEAKERIMHQIKSNISNMIYSEKRRVLNIIRIYKISVWLLPWKCKNVVNPDFKFPKALEKLNEVKLNQSYSNTYWLFFELYLKFQEMWESKSEDVVYLEKLWKTDFDSVLYLDVYDNRASSVLYSV